MIRGYFCLRRKVVNFSFAFNKAKQQEKLDESAKGMIEAVEAYQKAMQDGLAQYNETKKKAEGHINSGTRITKHRINL